MVCVLRHLTLFSLTFISPFLMAAPEAFAPTAVDTFEVKTLPAGMLLEAEGTGDYFRANNGLFGRLFRYLSGHDIAMTTPVEARIEPAAMYFWVAPAEQAKARGDKDGVRVITRPAQTVASLGARGGYSRENFNATRERLLAWIETQSDLKAIGPAYAVFWHGPFVPWFAKRYEVHVPIARTQP